LVPSSVSLLLSVFSKRKTTSGTNCWGRLSGFDVAGKLDIVGLLLSVSFLDNCNVIMYKQTF